MAEHRNVSGSTTSSVTNTHSTAGSVVESPPSNEHPYIVQFADGQTVKAYYRELALRRQEVDAELSEVSEDLRPFIIYRCQVGSKAYGLATEDSDDDLRGIYLPPARLDWSLYRLPEQLESINSEKDEVYWELGKFIQTRRQRSSKPSPAFTAASIGSERLNARYGGIPLVWTVPWNESPSSRSTGHANPTITTGCPTTRTNRSGTLSGCFVAADSFVTPLPRPSCGNARSPLRSWTRSTTGWTTTTTLRTTTSGFGRTVKCKSSATTTSDDRQRPRLDATCYMKAVHLRTPSRSTQLSPPVEMRFSDIDAPTARIGS